MIGGMINMLNEVDKIMYELWLFNEYPTYELEDGNVKIDLEAENYEVSQDYETLSDYFENSNDFEITCWNEPHEAWNGCYNWRASLTVKKLLGDD